MDIDKLVKGIQIIVKEEVKKQLPSLVKEVVKNETKSLRLENKKLKKKISLLESNDKPIGPTGHVNGNGTFMDDDVDDVPQFTSNPMLNQVLAETAQQYRPNPQNALINEASGNPEDMEEWPTMKHNMRPQPNVGIGGNDVEAVRNQMRSQMEAEFGGSGRPSPTGLGVQTGLPALDRVLNRDNTELVRKMEQSKKEPFRPGKGGSGW